MSSGGPTSAVTTSTEPGTDIVKPLFRQRSADDTNEEVQQDDEGNTKASPPGHAGPRARKDEDEVDDDAGEGPFYLTVTGLDKQLEQDPIAGHDTLCTFFRDAGDETARASEVADR
jgi:hypothetical protein